MEMLVKESDTCGAMEWGAGGVDEENKREGRFLSLVAGTQDS